MSPGRCWCGPTWRCVTINVNDAPHELPAGRPDGVTAGAGDQKVIEKASSAERGRPSTQLVVPPAMA